MTLSYQIAPPEPFNFSRTDEYPRLIRRFEQFRQASGLVEKIKKNQVNMLIYAMGAAADNIFQAFMLEDEDRKKWGSKGKMQETFHEEKRHYI